TDKKQPDRAEALDHLQGLRHNEANGTIHGEGSDAFQLLAGLKLGTCTSGGAESAEANGLGIGTPDAGALEISSTG
ncbi:MAG TPA: hypothetical protein VHU13_07060, partial [Solirubrobacteraceae bacterium]|nr:hypothetical protein [Solirubrobacteraceae bacterium]